MGPVRMISSGHELTTDYDEKTLHELGFKDMQVSVGFLSPGKQQATDVSCRSLWSRSSVM